MAGPERESRAEAVQLPQDPEEIARIEARNALIQTDAVLKLIDEGLRAKDRFKLRPSTLLELNRLAIAGINAYAGNYRPGPIEIGGSGHKPPPANEVPRLIEDMCDYVNDHLDASPVHLAAYIMWRLNWIHPFADGNGRTSRAASYLVMCVALGMQLPGTNTIPAQIAADKFPYYYALEDADKADLDGRLDVSRLEKLLGDMLANQLVEIHQKATKGFYSFKAGYEGSSS